MPDDCLRPGQGSVTTAVRIAGALLGVLISTGAFAQSVAPPPANPGPARYLVIPFENTTRDPRVYWLSEGSAVALTDDLLALGRPAITRDDRLRAFDRLRIPNTPILSHATMIRLGQIVGAAQVVLGSFELKGEVLTVRARTIRLDSGRISADISEVGSLADVFAVFGHVAQRIAPESRVPTEQMEQVHPPLTAFEQYVKGLVAQAPGTKESFLRQAVKQAPTFQRARLALWDVYTDQSKHREALAIVRDVTPTSRLARQARFLSSLSMISLGQLQEAYDVIAQLNATRPDSALFNNLGVIQMRRPATNGGRAITFFNEAAKLDNNDSDFFFNLGYAFYMDRDMPAAVYWLREAVRRNTADEQAHYVLGVALQATGSQAEGAREKELARRLSSVVAEWEKQSTAVPRGLERIKIEVDVPAALRVENVIVAAGQRDQQELAGIHLESGRRLAQAERDAEAIAELRRAIYLAPYQHEAHLVLGGVYLRDGRLDEAIDELKISIWSQDTLTAHLTLAEAFVAASNTDGARAELQAVLTRDPGNSRAKQLLAQLP